MATTKRRDHLLTGLIERITGTDRPKEATFYAIGHTVMIRTATSDGCWCDVEPLHNTEEARHTAARKAEQTAAALREYLAIHPD